MPVLSDAIVLLTTPSPGAEQEIPRQVTLLLHGLYLVLLFHCYVETGDSPCHIDSFQFQKTTR